MLNKLSLQDILAIDCFYTNDPRIPKTFLSLKMIIDWAENEVMQGNSSESLLILASLGLDLNVDSYEIQLYLNRYLTENHVKKPTLSYSCLVFLKIFFGKLVCSENLDEMSELMSEVLSRWYDFENQCFNKIYDYWTHIHYQYFDLYIDSYFVDSEFYISDEDRYIQLKMLATRFYSLLEDEDMLEILS